MRPLLVTFCLLAAFCAPADAQNAGTSQGDYLTTQFLVSNNRNYAFYNPARTPFLKQSDFYLQRAVLLDHTAFYHGALNCIIGTDATAGLHWSRLGMADIPERGLDGARTGSFDDASSSYAVSYARRLLPFLSLGATARLAHRSFYGASGYGFGFDAGLALLPSRFSYFDDLVLDMHFQNLIAPSLKLDFGDTYGTYTSVWPRNLRSALTFTSKGGRLDLGLAVNVVNFLPPADDDDAERRFVFDYSMTFRLARTITVTAGYNSRTVRLGWVLGYKAKTDAAVMTTIDPFLGNNTHFAFTQRFGNTRNDNYLIALSRNREGAADEILAEALALYDAGLYLDALYRFKELAFLFPAHQHLDRFLYLRGACYDALDLPEGALTSYEALVRTRPESPYVPAALMKSARLYAEAGRTGELNAAYQRLASGYRGATGRAAAAVYLGRYLHRTGDDSSAVDFLTAVPGTSAYAQPAGYLEAVCRLRTGDTDGARAAFMRIAVDTTTEPVVDMRDDARMALGHLAYRRAAYDTALAWYAQTHDTTGMARTATAHALFQKGEYAAAADSFAVGASGTGPGMPLYHENTFMAAHCRYLQADYRGALDGFNAYIATAMSDSVSVLADTAGTGAAITSFRNVRNALTAGRLADYGSRIRKAPFYKPLRPSEERAMDALRDTVAALDDSLRAARHRIRLNDARGEWLASAHEMAMKAARALIELRYRAVFEKYDTKIAELEKRLYELLPPEPEEPEEDTGTGDPDIEILDDEEEAESVR